MVKVGITDGRKRTRAEVSGKTNEWKDLIARSSFVGEVKLFVFRCQVQLTLTIYRAGKLSSFVRAKYDEKVDPCEGTAWNIAISIPFLQHSTQMSTSLYLFLLAGSTDSNTLSGYFVCKCNKNGERRRK